MSSTSTDRGSALVIVLLILMAVTILGIVGIDTSRIELDISTNGKQMRQSFYLAEAATAEGIQRLMETKPLDLNDQHPIWHHSREEIETEFLNFRDPAKWDKDGVLPDNAITASVDPDAFLAAVEWGVATGSSLVATDSRLYVNRVYGLCNRNNQPCIVEIGYYKRY